MIGYSDRVAFGAIKHERREAYRRRIWRLAFLLTGDERHASSLFFKLLDDKLDVTEVEPQRLDRFVILRTREAAAHGKEKLDAQAGAPATPDDAALGFEVAQRLPRQAMEAWLLARVDGLDDIESSRAMDCSRTALTNHLKLADAMMSETLGERWPLCLSAMRAAAGQTDAAPYIAQWATHRRKRRLRTALFAAVGITVALVFFWLKWRTVKTALFG